MPVERLVIVADAHLGVAPAEADEVLLDFLRSVPALGDGLLVNGDLFDFWFAYRRVIPRRGFLVAAELARLARCLPVWMTGGNHDRWGDSFWERDVGVTFSGRSLRFAFGDGEALAIHGDGIDEPHLGARVMHRVTRHPLTAFLFRLAPPDLAFRLVDRMSTRLADSTRDERILEAAAGRQLQWATARAEEDASLRLIVMGHTHRPAARQLPGGAWYVNPGAWMDGHAYAVASPGGVELRNWRGPRVPAAVPLPG